MTEPSVVEMALIGRHLHIKIDIGKPDGELGQDVRAIMTEYGCATVGDVTVSCNGDEDLSDEAKMECWNEIVERFCDEPDNEAVE